MSGVQPSSSQRIRRYRGGTWEEIEDPLVTEVRMRLFLNDELVTSLMCLPQEIEALAMGFALSEGIASQPQQIRHVGVDVNAGEIRLQADLDAAAAIARFQQWRTVTGSCGGGTTGQDLSAPSDCKRINTQMRMKRTDLCEAMRAFQEGSTLFRLTGGTHAVAAADVDGHILLFSEDIGRHNAFDKVLGNAARQHIDLEDKAILTTGRISSEIAAKAIRRKIPLLVSRSAPTSYAVALAERFFVTLVGFARGSRMNIYTYPQRIVEGTPILDPRCSSQRELA